jgi:quercetin dioxygenase-like cupin family protein
MDNGTLSASTYDAFRAHPLLRGADEVLERHWAPGQVVEEHTHPFDADAVVSAGEMWLTRAGVTEHLRAGDTFRVPAGTPHSERYGPQGATYWVARRKPR